MVQYYELKGKGDASSASDIETNTICDAIENAFSFLKGRRYSFRAKMLIESIISGKIFKGEAALALNEVVKTYIQKLFRPWKLVKAGDVSSVGCFKTSTIVALREVVDDDNYGYFPSTSRVSRARGLLDAHGKTLITFERVLTVYGEVYYLHFEKCLRLLLKACKLDELATSSSIKVALAVDGAEMFSTRTHVSSGVKITDERGVHPITGKPLTVHLNEDEDADCDEAYAKVISFVPYVKLNLFITLNNFLICLLIYLFKIIFFYLQVQSSELCCIMIIADAIDNKHLYEDVFKGFYEWGEKIRHEGVPASDLGPALMPFKVTHNADMKAAWYLSNKGGGCKTKNFFCHLCSCDRHSLTSFQVNELRCDRCKANNRMKCHHHQVCDNVSVEMILDELEQQLGQYYASHGHTFDEIQSRTNLQTDHMQANRCTDMNHIDYIIPHHDPEKLRQYSQFIARECILRGIQLVGTQVEEWRSVLRESVLLEAKISCLLKVRQWKADGVEIAPLVELVELLIPCILHLENRIGEKIITMILRKGLDIYPNRKEEYITSMQNIFRMQVLGTEAAPSQWRLYSKKDNDGNVILEPISVRNNMSRCIINNIDKIIEGAISNETAGTLIVALSKYKEAIDLLTKHRELSEDEQDHFQDLIDDFYQSWIDVFGDEGVTNYIHLLSSGHIHYFLRRYGCLYLYSQQGWEALNSKVQTFILQNSSRGGHNSGENGSKSYIFPLIRYIIRDLLWKTGEGDKFFLSQEEKGIRC
jgi:hypothetical protein